MPQSEGAYRIMEYVSHFADGTKKVEYHLQTQDDGDPEKWELLYKSTSLGEARRALLYVLPAVNGYMN